jgi:hypothetical protein
MICDDRLMEYEPLWKMGMYRKDGQWHLNSDDDIHPLIFNTTEEALAYTKDCRLTYIKDYCSNRT